eukprot:Phypoly_transcript_22933.p1 GENE.Phypoly_transcript_22933~~Phypoly_transcript_22933.p1  ORF type:complete len:157 (+),score=22.87 Phypoly_transcript_22933:29-472(+)
MAATWRVLLLVIVFIQCIHLSIQTSGCLEKGFSDALLCSSCNDLEQHVPDAELVAECRECCSAEADDNKKYVSAQLVTCRCAHHINLFPHIFEFIDKKAKNYPKLTTVDQRGSAPILRLTDEEGNVEALNIETWKTEHLEQFMEKLK